MISNTDQLEERFNTLAVTLADLTLKFKDDYSTLSKNSMERVSLAFIEYPTPAEKEPQSQEEATIINLAVKIKETQMAMAVIHSIIEGEKNEQ